jgi:hypothetical protein
VALRAMIQKELVPRRHRVGRSRKRIRSRRGCRRHTPKPRTISCKSCHYQNKPAEPEPKAAAAQPHGATSRRWLPNPRKRLANWGTSVETPKRNSTPALRSFRPKPGPKLSVAACGIAQETAGDR